MNDPLDFWRLCEELTIIQAALLVAGVDPALYTKVESMVADARPIGFDAAKHAITSALRRGVIEGQPREHYETNSFGEPTGAVIPDSIDPWESTVQVDSLREWLRRRGVKTGFFFPEEVELPDYLDKSNPRFAPKLAAAVQAWLAIAGREDTGRRSPKQALEKWLREHAAELGLTDQDGKVNETGVEEIAKVANWQLTGGAPKTPSS